MNTIVSQINRFIYSLSILFHASSMHNTQHTIYYIRLCLFLSVGSRNPISPINFHFLLKAFLVFR